MKKDDKKTAPKKETTKKKPTARKTVTIEAVTSKNFNRHFDKAVKEALTTGIANVPERFKGYPVPAKDTPLIFKQIPKIMADIVAIEKKESDSVKYKFRAIDDMYNALHDILAKHKVFTVPVVLDERTEERKSRQGGVLIYRILKIRYIFYAEDGSRFSSTVIGEAFDSGDKAANKSMSAAHKYALIQIFCIPTEGDKDSENATYEVAPKETPAASPAPAKNGKNGDKKQYPKDVEFRLMNGKKIWTNRFEILALFADMKKLIGPDKYYEVLGKFSREKSNEIQSVGECQSIYNEMIEAQKTTDPPAKVDVLSPEEAAQKVNKLIMVFVENFKCDSLTIMDEIKKKFEITKFGSMDPDQADAVISYLEKAIKTKEAAKGKEDLKKQRDNAKKKREEKEAKK